MLRNICRKIGLRRQYNAHTYLTEYLIGGRKVFEKLEKSAIPLIVEKNLSMVTNQLYALQNILPEMHTKTFAGYEGIFEGKEVVVMAAGPSLAKYTRDKRITEAIHIGVNKLASFDIDLDYYFMADWTAIQNYQIEEDLIKNPAKKFFGLGILSDECGTTSFATPLDFMQSCDASPYFAMNYMSHQIIQKDISRHPLFGWGSIIIPAFHFALYGNPKRIYLVGCDCSSAGHFDSQKWSMCDVATQRLIEEWRRMSLFAKYYYPNTEIVSINPVGLRGMFKDIEL